MANPVGRPRTTIKDLPDDWESLICDAGQEGASIVEMRCVLGIGDSAWETLLEDSEEFRLAVKKAQMLCQVWWERHGRSMTKGESMGNATVWIFNMKNRFGWADKLETKNNHDVKVDTAKDLTDDELNAELAKLGITEQ